MYKTLHLQTQKHRTSNIYTTSQHLTTTNDTNNHRSNQTPTSSSKKSTTSLYTNSNYQKINTQFKYNPTIQNNKDHKYQQYHNPLT